MAMLFFEKKAKKAKEAKGKNLKTENSESVN